MKQYQQRPITVRDQWIHKLSKCSGGCRRTGCPPMRTSFSFSLSLSLSSWELCMTCSLPVHYTHQIHAQTSTKDSSLYKAQFGNVVDIVRSTSTYG